MYCSYHEYGARVRIGVVCHRYHTMIYLYMKYRSYMYLAANAVCRTLCGRVKYIIRLIGMAVSSVLTRAGVRGCGYGTLLDLLWAFLLSKHRDVVKAGECMLRSLEFRCKQNWTRMAMELSVLAPLVRTGTNTYGIVRPKEGEDKSTWITMSPQQIDLRHGSIEAYQVPCPSTPSPLPHGC